MAAEAVGHHGDGDGFFNGVGEVFFGGGVADDGDVEGDEVAAVGGKVVAG